MSPAERWEPFTIDELRTIAVGLSLLGIGTAAKLAGEIAYAIATRAEDGGKVPSLDEKRTL